MSQRKGNGRGGASARARVSRENILAAARMVFARRSYGTASLRMIGAEGGFEHPLIHYYFPSKAKLFEAVIAEVVEELVRANREWFEGLTGRDPAHDLGVHLDRILEYNLLHPEPFKILFLNIAQVEEFADVPGIQLIPAIMQATQDAFLEHMPVTLDPEEARRVNNVFCNMILWYLGADFAQARVLGMEPDSRAYREWAKGVITAAMLPWLEKLLAPAG